MKPATPARHAGFTLIELLVTLALVGLMAMVALPLYAVSTTHAKEAELRQALRTIRAGLDAYKEACDSGLLAKEAGESGFPASLDRLTEVLEVTRKRDFGLNPADAPRHMVILRQLPRDPFHPDPNVPAAQTWDTRAYATRPDDPRLGDDVFDVSSKSTRVGMDGTAYNTW